MIGLYLLSGPRLLCNVRSFCGNCKLDLLMMRTISSMPAHANQDVISLSNNKIIKSASDLREYRGLELANKMKVMLISDPLTDKAAASMDVNIGSFCDPDELPGLAHFCEHMLFLGTSKYPDEAEYSKFISQHAGSCNAFTTDEHTNYFFDIGHEHLRGILDRFAQFFLSPLFDAGCTEREVNAVHSEHEKNIMSDGWRMIQIEKATADPSHRYSRFSTGNKDTLETIPKSKNITVRDELLKYHDKYYSANVMGLAVLGKESLNELEQMVVELFGAIDNKNVERSTYDSPYKCQELQKFIRTVPIKDIRSLCLKFPIFDCTEFYKTLPSGYLAHLIGHEGPGSVLSELKRLGWSNSLAAGSDAGARGYESFIVSVDLTEEGLDHINDIITLIFQYIVMLRKHDVQEWIFEEIKELNALNFRFKDKERPTSCVLKTSQALHDFPLEDVLSAGTLLSEFKPDLIRSVLDKLRPENMRVSCASKSFEGVATMTEKWYGTQYIIEDIPNVDIQRWSEANLNPAFALPPKNEFIPADFAIAPLSAKHSTIPTSVKNEQLSQVWYKQDDQFKLPKACVMFELFSPIAYANPQNANKLYMFAELFKDALNEYAYSAELAGLKYSLKSSIYGIQVDIKGYHDKQRVLVEKIFKKIASFKVDPRRFEIIKEIYLRVLKNFEAEQPYTQALFYTRAVKCEKAWLKQDLLEALPRLSCEDLQAFINEFVSRLHLQILVHGNVTFADSLKLSGLVERILKQDAMVTPLTAEQLMRYREVCLPQGSRYVYQFRNTVRDISAIDFFLQVGLQNTRENVLLKLIAQIINEPCFNILRTKENLGYIVFSGVAVSNGVQGLRVVIQSELSPDYLEQRAEAFINHIEAMLDEMEPAEFNQHVAALIARILEKPKKLVTESLKYWVEILSEQLQFRRPEIEASHLKTIKKDDVTKFYKEFLHINAPKRAKLVVHVLARDLKQCVATRKPQAQENPEILPCPTLKESTVITDIEEFKSNLPLFDRVAPYVDDVEEKLASVL